MRIKGSNGELEVQGTLHKGVAALAIEPVNLPLNVTARKAYNIMLWYALRSAPESDGGYSRPLSDIIHGFGGTTKSAQRVRDYIGHLCQTAIRFHAVTSSDKTIDFDGQHVLLPAGTEQERQLTLLAEVRWTLLRGKTWLSWYYPPSVQEALLNPERWAQLQLASIVALTTYTALALYELCARFKDAPGGLTSRKPVDWWTTVLREGGGVKPREWRKFKSELLQAAITEINESTEILIELVEHREHGVVTQAQFKVRTQTRKRAQQAPDALDVSVPMQAAAVGIQDQDAYALMEKFGAARLQDALTALEKQLEKGAFIPRRGDYVRKILSNQVGEGAGDNAQIGKPLSLAEASAEQVARAAQDELIAAWRAERIAAMHKQFAALPPAEQAHWIDAAGKKLPQTGGIRKRIVERAWESPLIRNAVLAEFAVEQYGPAWGTPTKLDLEDIAQRRVKPLRPPR